jgi:regulation of enolase protein 1 (concanavalin A-like superfamily)
MEKIQGIPFTLSSSHLDAWNFSAETDQLSARALPHSDFYCNPQGGFGENALATLNALALLGTPEAIDFQFHSKVKVEFNSNYDAGVLFIWSDAKNWAKFCFEYSRDKEAMVVSVVTRGASDDANSFTLPIHEVWLRISRTAEVYAFHASTDGVDWKLIRVFTLGGGIEDHQIGFVAQAPTGAGCDVTFEGTRFSYTSLKELRDGS